MFSLAVDESGEESETNIVVMTERQMRRSALHWVKLVIDSFMGSISLNLEAKLDVDTNRRYGSFFRAMRFINGDNEKRYLTAVEFERNPKALFLYGLEDGEGFVEYGHGVEETYHQGDWVYEFGSWNGDKLFSVDESGGLSVLTVSD